MWHAAHPPVQNVALHLVPVPARETSPGTQTRLTPETDADYRTSATAGRLAPFAGVIDRRVSDQHIRNQRGVSYAARLLQRFQAGLRLFKLVDHHGSGMQSLLQLLGMRPL